MQQRGRGKQVGSLSGAGKRGGVGGLHSAKKSPVGIVHQFSWCEYSHHSQFPASYWHKVAECQGGKNYRSCLASLGKQPQYSPESRKMGVEWYQHQNFRKE